MTETLRIRLWDKAYKELQANKAINLLIISAEAEHIKRILREEFKERIYTRILIFCRISNIICTKVR